MPHSHQVGFVWFGYFLPNPAITYDKDMIC